MVEFTPMARPRVKTTTAKKPLLALRNRHASFRSCFMRRRYHTDLAPNPECPYDERMKITLSVFVMAVALSASPAAAQAPEFSMKGQYELVKGWVTKGAAAMPEANYSFKPTPEVRSFGQLLGQIANATGMICTISAGGNSPLAGDAEKLTTKAELTKALADAFASCDNVWAAVTPAWQTEMVDVFGA
ncbi:MAG: DinB family protein [Acidobacteria bacterium]|nr:DinB family protein [Acidobacteriota bacterium]